MVAKIFKKEMGFYRFWPVVSQAANFSLVCISPMSFRVQEFAHKRCDGAIAIDYLCLFIIACQRGCLICIPLPK